MTAVQGQSHEITYIVAPELTDMDIRVDTQCDIHKASRQR